MADNNCTCAQCGDVIIPRINKTTGLPSKAKRKFCPPKCGERFHTGDRSRYVRRPHRPKTVECEHCKKVVQRRVSGGGRDAGKYCSRDCAFAAAAERSRRNYDERLAELMVKRRVRRETQALKRIAAYVERPPVFAFACLHCASEMLVRRRLGLHKQVCDACILDRKRRLKRVHKLKRRASKRGAEADRIDPIKVFERDKWRCHICGERTPQKYRGTQHDMAPELEHIVSIADGGTHTWGNVACACRRCNREKGASSFGQLGLRIAV